MTLGFSYILIYMKHKYWKSHKSSHTVHVHVRPELKEIAKGVHWQCVTICRLTNSQHILVVSDQPNISFLCRKSYTEQLSVYNIFYGTHSYTFSAFTKKINTYTCGSILKRLFKLITTGPMGMCRQSFNYNTPYKYKAAECRISARISFFATAHRATASQSN